MIYLACACWHISTVAEVALLLIIDTMRTPPHVYHRGYIQTLTASILRRYVANSYDLSSICMLTYRATRFMLRSSPSIHGSKSPMYLLWIIHIIHVYRHRYRHLYSHMYTRHTLRVLPSVVDTDWRRFTAQLLQLRPILARDQPTSATSAWIRKLFHNYHNELRYRDW